MNYFDKKLQMKSGFANSNYPLISKVFGSSSVFNGTVDNKAAFGPTPEEEPVPFPEIDFTPSGNTPEIDLGAPSYSLELAERRRN